LNQSQLASLLSHFMSIVGQLEPNWTRALFTRMKLLDPDFQGEVLAVMSEYMMAYFDLYILIIMILSFCSDDIYIAADRHTSPSDHSLSSAPQGLHTQLRTRVQHHPQGG
jgi:hypothetical protein